MSSTDPGAVTSVLHLRPADLEDASEVARVFLEARAAAVPTMPPPVHTAAEVHDYHRERLAAGDELWVAETSGRPGDEVVGYCHLAGDWLDALYVAPRHAGQGVGTTLIDLVKALRPGGFALWVFATNEPAMRFYRRHGLIELESTDGSGNEERTPDVRMVWPGEDPLASLRRQVDEVDAELAHLLARRTALTGAIQRFKPVPGHAGRDPGREAEIVRRMAERAPGLEPRALARIMHEVIAAGLDRAENDDPDRIGRG